MPKILKFYKHCIKIELRFSDLDAIGHVNNSRYQTFLEEARIAYFHDVFHQDKSSWLFNSVVSKISIDFIKPIEYGDEIYLYTRFFNFNQRSHEVHNVFVRKVGEKMEIVAKANTLMAAYDYIKKEPGEFPQNYQEIVERFEGPGD
jgi:acyl-CoA thioester hydrolase